MDKVKQQNSGENFSASERKIVPIVLCADAHYGAYIAAILQSALENASDAHDYVICIFDCGLKAEDCAALQQQLAGKANFSLKIYPLQGYLADNKEAFSVLDGQYLSPASYARLLIPQLCADYPHIIYADIDMIFNRDPAALITLDLGENYIAGAADKNIEAERRSRAGIKKYSREVLGLNDDEAYINSGLLVFNAAKWREKGLVARCLAELSKRHFKRHDQDMINFICKGKIHYLDGSWNSACKLSLLQEQSENAAETADAAEKEKDGAPPAVCHFVGGLKPWHIPPESLSAAAGKYAGLWWDYAGRTAIYPKLRAEAALHQAKLNSHIGKQRYCLFGLPVWVAETMPRKKKYSLFGLPLVKIQQRKTGGAALYICGLKMPFGGEKA